MFHAAPQPHKIIERENWDALLLVGVETDTLHPERITRILLRTPTKDDGYIMPLMPHAQGQDELTFDEKANGWWMQADVLARMPEAFCRQRPALKRAQFAVENGLGGLHSYRLDS